MSSTRSSTQILKVHPGTREINPGSHQATQTKDPAHQQTPRKLSKIPVHTQGSVRGTVIENEYKRSARKKDPAALHDDSKDDTDHTSRTFERSGKQRNSARGSASHKVKNAHNSISKLTSASLKETPRNEATVHKDEKEKKTVARPNHLQKINDETKTTNRSQENGRDRKDSRVAQNDAKTKNKERVEQESSELRNSVVGSSSRQSTKVKVLSPSAQNRIDSEKSLKQNYGNAKHQSRSNSLDTSRKEQSDVKKVPDKLQEDQEEERTFKPATPDIRPRTMQDMGGKEINSQSSSLLKNTSSQENTEVKQTNTEIKQASTRQDTEVNQSSSGINAEVRDTRSLPHTDVIQNDSQQNTEVEEITLQQSTDVKQTKSQQSPGVKQKTPRQNTEVTQTSSRQNTEVKQTPSQQNTAVSQTASRQNTAVKQTTLQQSTPVKQTPSQQNTEVRQTPSRRNTVVKQTTPRQNTEVNQTPSRQNTAVKQTTHVKQTTPRQNTSAKQSVSQQNTEVKQISSQQKTIEKQTTSRQNAAVKEPISHRGTELKQTKTPQNTEVKPIKSRQNTEVNKERSRQNTPAIENNSVRGMEEIHSDAQQGVHDSADKSNKAQKREKTPTISHNTNQDKDNADDDEDDDDDNEWPDIRQQTPGKTSFSRHHTRVESRHGANSRSSEADEAREKPETPKVPALVLASSADYPDPDLNDTVSLPELKPKEPEENRCSYCDMTFRSKTQLDYHKSRLCVAKSPDIFELREDREFFTVGNSSVIHSTPRGWSISAVPLRLSRNHSIEHRVSFFMLAQVSKNYEF